MKKIFWMMAAIMVFSGMILMTSCSKDDDKAVVLPEEPEKTDPEPEPAQDTSFLGVWSNDITGTDEYGWKEGKVLQFVEFKSDGTGVITTFFFNGETPAASETESFTYVVKGNAMTVNTNIATLETAWSIVNGNLSFNTSGNIATLESVNDETVGKFNEWKALELPKPADHSQLEAFTGQFNNALVNVAKNLNFASLQAANTVGLKFIEDVLSNPNFKASLKTAIDNYTLSSLTPVETGSSLANAGYAYYADINLNNIKLRFNIGATGDVTQEASEHLEFLWNSQNGDMKMTIEPNGNSGKVLLKNLSQNETAIILSIPESLKISIEDNLSGSWHEAIGVSINAGIIPNDEDITKFSLGESALELSGNLFTDIQNMGTDATQLDFNISRNPNTEKSTNHFDFIHNGISLLKMDIVHSNHGSVNLRELVKSSSIVNLLQTLVQNVSVDNLSLTLLDDLKMDVKIGDVAKSLGLLRKAVEVQEGYADEATIEAITQQLNSLIEMSISQASTGVEAKSKFQTTQFGIDYFPIVSLLFEGENDYIPANKLMGLKNWEYVINIIDHASEPAAQSITVLRKLIEVIESFIQ